jgi:hypothetical protein
LRDGGKEQISNPPSLDNSCLGLTTRTLKYFSTNNVVFWEFCVTNAFTNEIKFLSVFDLPAGISASQEIISLPSDLNPGQGACLSLFFTNSPKLTNFCFTMGAHSTNFVLCCSSALCLAAATRPALTITRSAENVILSWPDAFPEYVLESTPALNPPIAWSTESGPRVVIAGIIYVTVPINDRARFFRLRSP